MFNSVWLIDDDPVNNFMTEMLISINKFAENVRTFTSAEEPLELIKKEIKDGKSTLPDVIFLDINMPDISGWDFLKTYSELPEELKQNCRLYMLSSTVDQKDISMAKNNEHVQDFVSKPLAVEDLEIIKLQKSGEEF